MQKLLLSTLIGVLSIHTHANEQKQINDRLNDNRIQKETVTTPIQPALAQTKPTPPNKENNTIRMSADELINHPDLVLRALQPALIQGNTDTLNVIFPIYQKLSEEFHSPLLTKWSEAILARADNDLEQSIRLYREILAEHADNEPARLQLAAVLFSNNELEAAEDQFKKLRSEQLPVQITEIIDEYLNAIRQRDRWTFSGGVTYLRDPNINNAPKAGTTYGNWTPPAQESAEGIGYNLNLGKKWSWGNGFYNELRLNGNGKHYWDNRKYNEMSGRMSIGLGFQNAKTDITLLPFMEQTLYAGGSKQSETLKRFSKSSGIALEWQHWLNSKWQINSNYEYGEQRYANRKHLNGNLHYIALGGLYIANAKRYFFANINYNRTSTKDRDDSYFRRGITLGWQQEWNWGLSTRLSANFAQKRYKDKMPIFQITQRSKEIGLQASIWHRAVHYWGITPRLTYNFTRIRSNHVFYSYDKHRFFLDFSKSF